MVDEILTTLPRHLLDRIAHGFGFHEPATFPVRARRHPPRRGEGLRRDRSGLAQDRALRLADRPLTVGERESCEALTSRFARLNDFLVQRVFHTLDQIELLDEGSPLDRLQRAEGCGLITSAEQWRELRMVRNSSARD